MISNSIEQKLNEQIQKEFYSAYLYLSMEAYFASENLDGFANWFRVQAQEERDHAMLIFDFINHVGGRVALKQIDAPQVEFGSVEEVLDLSLKHEQFVTRSIYDIVELALEEKDHKTGAFLQWFVTEQAEEEANAESNLKKAQMVGKDGKGILMLDQQMGQRTYTPPSLAVE